MLGLAGVALLIEVELPQPEEHLALDAVDLVCLLELLLILKVAPADELAVVGGGHKDAVVDEQVDLGAVRVFADNVYVQVLADDSENLLGVPGAVLGLEVLGVGVVHFYEDAAQDQGDHLQAQVRHAQDVPQGQVDPLLANFA